jgi:hypothetical protein
VLLATGQSGTAVTVLGHLEQTVQDDTNMQGEVTLLRAIIAQHSGNYQLAVELSKKALSFLPPDNLRAKRS